MNILNVSDDEKLIDFKNQQHKLYHLNKEKT